MCVYFYLRILLLCFYLHILLLCFYFSLARLLYFYLHIAADSQRRNLSLVWRQIS